jgi:hypothetical protein
MNEIGERFLPIGTVVLLQGASKKVMITGFASVSPDTGEKVFDYSGCIFPEGFYSYNEVCVFDHSQIQEIFHMGLVNDEEKNFKEELKAKIVELANGNVE